MCRDFPRKGGVSAYVGCIYILKDLKGAQTREVLDVELNILDPGLLHP